MKTKICSKCHIEKTENEFSKDKRVSDGLQSICKECNRAYRKLFRKTNPRKIQQQNKEYNLKHQTEKQKYNKSYYQQNQNEIKQQQKDYRLQNRHQRNIYFRNKYSKNSLFKISVNIRNLIKSSFKRQGYSKKSRTYQILGCSFEELQKYLFDNAKLRYPDFNEQDFLKENFYQIHHKMPLETGKTEEEIIRLNHYTNLELLTVEDHIKVHSGLLLG